MVDLQREAGELTLTLCAALIWIFAFSVSTVSCQINIKGLIGEDVLLPCIYNGRNSIPEDVSLLWWDKQKKVLLTLVNGTPVSRVQHQNFRGRVVTFSDLYRRGNFSIVLQNVQQSDSNDYTCNVPQVYFQRNITLTVSGKRSLVPALKSKGFDTMTTKVLTPQLNQTSSISSCLHLILLLILLSFSG
ncbi:V-set domain-containing T-cell activation inhibitor 1 isoform X1 [Lates calcarifer]|uniref:V-set domain-containing T-cell activation inhibitor 1 isoform X1 n=1 Tax=Lates calcarifer TaxID=8187 RepID=A0AAJ8AY85_LATCA|nr:V-set domain-containing T-cell activation inhibitor 1 isoform X1 [Lates calcarifer]